MILQTDVLIIGAGVLGTSLAYEISSMTDRKVLLIDRENGPAFHSSSRNTGVVHRPFYVDPVDKAVYARSAIESYEPWRELAEKEGLPWVQRGVMELALNDRDVNMIERYSKWAQQNGMTEDEVILLDEHEVKSEEPLVVARGAILSRKDVNVSYGPMTRAVSRLAEGKGVKTLWNLTADRIIDGDEPTAICSSSSGLTEIKAKIIINVSGGGAYRLARSLGLASEYSELHFRGDYWMIRGFGGIHRNIYTVPRNPGYPFLDPHFIIRPDGQTEIGPNAFLVSGPFSYSGTISEIFRSASILKDSMVVRLIFDKDMLRLIWNDWRMSVLKSQMVKRVKQFIPSLDASCAYQRGTSGIRHSLISKEGFVPEAVIIGTSNSIHVLNFNSPGATGAPAFALALLSQLISSYDIKLVNRHAAVWNDLINKVNSFDIGFKIENKAN
ncbi:MAG: NAD(P)/FAD-dependent oxidoreductase [Nitrososphaeria archaeon]